MKKIVLFLLITLLFSCKENNKSTVENTTQEKETITSKTTQDEEELLVGIISCKDLEQGIYNDWFVENFNDHTLDIETVNKLKPLLNDVFIQVFMGTWCSDSQREVPALHKILETADFDENKMEIIAVNREKRTPKGLEKGMDIQYVPTLIFYKNKKELGRIVESPVETLEKDMLTILSEKPYKHNYQE